MRTNKANRGHPLRQARRARALARQEAHVCNRTCKRFRTGKVKFVRVIDEVTLSDVVVHPDGSATINGHIVSSHMDEVGL